MKGGRGSDVDACYDHLVYHDLKMTEANIGCLSAVYLYFCWLASARRLIAPDIVMYIECSESIHGAGTKQHATIYR